MEQSKIITWNLLAEIYGYAFFFSFILTCFLLFVILKFGDQSIGREYAILSLSSIAIYILLLPIKMSLLTMKWNFAFENCAILMFLSDFLTIFSTWSLTLLAMERISFIGHNKTVSTKEPLKKLSFPIIWIISIFQAVKPVMNYKNEQMHLDNEYCHLVLESSGENAWLLLMYTVVIPVLLIFFQVYIKRHLLLESDLNSIATNLSLYLFFATMCFFPTVTLKGFDCNQYYGLRELRLMCLELKIYYIPIMTYTISYTDYMIIPKQIFSNMCMFFSAILSKKPSVMKKITTI
ncbi:envelope protein UL78 [macacine betaherpesvirus 9]|uniref:Envelope protein UL78 n=1 Tax=macacine betaherpesvirus 9 TaxID=2560568 RepID=A0A192XP63_9BETA|nr:envelope protein UL78 [macacine betaherpesvirus 9]ANC96572.1 envelope protein UL78 [macacine betaherpesvirus 9]